VEQKAELAEIVRKGPDLAVHGVVRWRRVDLQAVIRERFAVELAERTVGTILRQLGFSRLSSRSYHPKKDEDAQEAFKKNSPPFTASDQSQLENGQRSMFNAAGMRQKISWKFIGYKSNELSH